MRELKMREQFEAWWDTYCGSGEDYACAKAAWEAALASEPGVGLDREAAARAACEVCGDNPDHKGDARGNDYRWQDYLDVVDAVLAASHRQQPEVELTDAEIEALEGRAVVDRDAQGWGWMCRKTFARLVIAAHKAKQAGGVK